MAYPYTPPDFLQNQGPDVIHRRMLAGMPPDTDKSELQIPWDFTRPAANEKARFVEFELNETIKLIFPQWSYDEWLDLHAETEGLERKKANQASGVLTVIGKPGTNVDAGFKFATVSNLTPSVLFEAAEAVTLTNGSITITDTANPATPVIKLTLNQPPGNQVLLLTVRPTADDPDVSELIIQEGNVWTWHP